ncbi:MAG: hypothetical protein AB1443_00110 [Pseudomonadota bacterium]
MIQDKKEFGLGLALLAAFFVVLALIISPLLEGGRNTLDYLDNTFNSISKNAAYFIPGIADKARQFDGTDVSVNIKAADAGQAARLEKILNVAAVKVVADGSRLVVSGNLGRMIGSALADADLMFKNDGAAVSGKYDIEGKRVLYDWHQAFATMTMELNRQGKFQEGKLLRDVQTKALEPAYNYYGVEAIPMSSMFWVAMAALIGYVIYTVWYGFAILFLFEGWGLKLNH